MVVDLETTGGRIGPGAITEIGAYRMEGPRMTDSFATLVRPRGPISPFVTRLTSITNEMVAEAPPIEQVLPAFREFLGDAVMVAHNAQFDFAYLDLEFRRVFGMGIKNPVLCTLRLSRRFAPSLRRRRLDALAEHFGLSTEGRHRGLGDARMAAELLSIFLDIAAQNGITRVDRLIDLHSRGAAGRRIERHVPPEAIAALPMASGVYLMRNECGDLLYIGKARRLRERVASYFNGGGGRRCQDRRPGEPCLRDRHPGDAFGARRRAARGAAHPRTQTALQPHAQGHGAGVLRAAGPDGRISTADAFDAGSRRAAA